MDWSALPGDLLRLFSRRLHDPLDFLRFRAVCRTWRSAAAASPPPFLPWLLARPVHPTARPSLSFYSLSSAALRSVAAPSATCCLLGHASSHLLFSDHGHPSNPLLLANPLTGADLPLPPSPFDAFAPITQGYYLPGPDSPVVIYDATRVFFHHPGGGGGESTSPGWTKVPVEDLVAENMYHAGKMFVCNDRGRLTIFDATTLAVLGDAAPPPPPPAATLHGDAFRCSSFVPSGDELLCVIRYFRSKNKAQGELLEDPCALEVHRLEISSEKGAKPRWVQMRSIGDRMLFVGLYQGFSLRAADFAGLEGNCIYFFRMDRASRSFIYRFSMNDGHIDELPGPWMHACTWFVPSLS
ncbi:F-box protein At2g26160-like [Oryza brachyantha]|uniref:KIB1-4 beta-propeller domain-containing protein n=1 Tax=Oryza brachyantha TaxID=4533 RepID=J3N133_ORYBR|nr:F-box protein At2g26160-like [Oryza brachyantha]